MPIQFERLGHMDRRVPELVQYLHQNKYATPPRCCHCCPPSVIFASNRTATLIPLLPLLLQRGVYTADLLTMPRAELHTLLKSFGCSPSQWGALVQCLPQFAPSTMEVVQSIGQPVFRVPYAVGSETCPRIQVGALRLRGDQAGASKATIVCRQCHPQRYAEQMKAPIIPKPPPAKARVSAPPSHDAVAAKEAADRELEQCLRMTDGCREKVRLAAEERVRREKQMLESRRHTIVESFNPLAAASRTVLLNWETVEVQSAIAQFAEMATDGTKTLLTGAGFRRLARYYGVPGAMTDVVWSSILYHMSNRAVLDQHQSDVFSASTPTPGAMPLGSSSSTAGVDIALPPMSSSQFSPAVSGQFNTHGHHANHASVAEVMALLKTKVDAADFVRNGFKIYSRSWLIIKQEIDDVVEGHNPLATSDQKEALQRVFEELKLVVLTYEDVVNAFEGSPQLMLAFLGVALSMLIVPGLQRQANLKKKASARTFRRVSTKHAPPAGLPRGRSNVRRKSSTTSISPPVTPGAGGMLSVPT